MKKSISIIVSVLMYGLIIFLSCYYVILPNVKTINETKKTRKLTSEEKSKLISEVNDKYLNLEKDNEYGQLIISYPEKISGKVIVEYQNTGIQIFAVILKIVSITGLTAYVIYSTKKEKNTNVK